MLQGLRDGHALGRSVYSSGDEHWGEDELEMKFVVLDDAGIYKNLAKDQDPEETSQRLVFECTVENAGHAALMVTLGGISGAISPTTVVFLDDEVIWPELELDGESEEED